MDLAQARKLEQIYLFPTYRRQPLMIAGGEGAWVFDEQGRRFLDFLGGLAVNALGHCHPAIVDAVRGQAGRLSHVSNLYYTEPMLLTARELCRISKMSRAFFCNSGAEANEAAIKLARRHSRLVRGEGRHEIVTFTGAFHGRTMGSLSATGEGPYTAGFEPMLPGFTQIEFNDVKALKKAVTDSVCAILVEPVQGEAGVFEMSREFADAIGELREKKGVTLIADEVQCGLGRTGRWFAHDHYGLTADILTLAKPLGGGLPMGAMLAQGPAANAFEPGSHASTFGGGPIACQAALAFLNAVKSEKLLANVDRMGKYLKRRILELQKKGLPVREVRGRGLMIGVGVDKPAGRIGEAMLEAGVLVNAVRDHTVRILPPFVIGENEAEMFLKAFESALRE